MPWEKPLLSPVPLCEVCWVRSRAQLFLLGKLGDRKPLLVPCLQEAGVKAWDVDCSAPCLLV